MFRKRSHLIEPEIIRGEELLQFSEEVPVVEVVNSFYITGTVIQAACDLMEEEQRLTCARLTSLTTTWPLL